MDALGPGPGRRSTPFTVTGSLSGSGPLVGGRVLKMAPWHIEQKQNLRNPSLTLSHTQMGSLCIVHHPALSSRTQGLSATKSPRWIACGCSSKPVPKRIPLVCGSPTNPCPQAPVKNIIKTLCLGARTVQSMKRPDVYTCLLQGDCPLHLNLPGSLLDRVSLCVALSSTEIGKMTTSVLVLGYNAKQTMWYVCPI